MDRLVGGHRRRRVGVVVVPRPRLGALREREDEHRAEPAGQQPEDARAEVTAARPADVVAEQVEPVLLVAALRLGQREQDLALLTGATGRDVAVDGGLGALVGQVLPPPADLAAGRGRTCGRCGLHASWSQPTRRKSCFRAVFRLPNHQMCRTVAGIDGGPSVRP